MKQRKLTPQEIAADLNSRYPISTENTVRAMELDQPAGAIIYVMGDNFLLGTSAITAELAITAMPPVSVSEAARRLNLQPQTVQKYISPIPGTSPKLYSLAELENYARNHRGRQGPPRTTEPKKRDVSPATMARVLPIINAHPGLTLRQWGELAGVSRSTVCNVLRLDQLAKMQNKEGEK